MPDKSETKDEEETYNERIEILYRLDERTERIDNRIDELSDDVTKNKQDINSLQDKVRRNTTILGGIGSAATAVVLWVSDKVGNLI